MHRPAAGSQVVTTLPTTSGPAPVFSSTLTANPGGITVVVEYPPAG